MSILVVPLAPRGRLRARSASAPEPAAPRTSAELDYVLSRDGLAVSAQGRCAPSLLPRADSVALVLADCDVSWHRITLPKAPAARLRAALAGVLEDALLEDAEQLHLALAPQAAAGEPTWVAAVDKRWLAAELAALEKANVFVDRVLPASWPDEPPNGHFELADETDSRSLALHWAHADGVATLSLQGGLARALLTQPLPEGARWSATPAAATAAERWLDAPVVVLPAAERALQATHSLWDLRQFDLARRSKGTRALRDALRGLRTPAWRPARYGIAALVLTQLVGLNLWAWHLRSTLDAKRESQVALLQSTFPHVRAVLDAPLQMQREVALLRAAAGRPDASDLEPLLRAAAAAWPADLAAVESIRFEPGKLTLAASSWDAGRIEQFRAQLQPMGLRLDVADGRLVLSRAAISGGPS
ncbi:MAG TPA: type II secretion system protein GspL [Burkholderiaceae bacterium]|nr:type II secretion system protein GspL [Burkholderiaceae bacterium]